MSSCTHVFMYSTHEFMYACIYVLMRSCVHVFMCVCVPGAVSPILYIAGSHVTLFRPRPNVEPDPSLCIWLASRDWWGGGEDCAPPPPPGETLWFIELMRCKARTAFHTIVGLGTK